MCQQKRKVLDVDTPYHPRGRSDGPNKRVNYPTKRSRYAKSEPEKSIDKIKAHIIRHERKRWHRFKIGTMDIIIT